MDQQTPQFDYIVVGCGGVGSSAVYWLAKRCGKRVLGLEQFNLGHDHGGSQDLSRIIRLSYNDKAYIPLARGTYEAWGEAERESGIQLVFKTGGLDICKRNTPGHAVLEKFATAMTEQNVPFERFEGESIRSKFPQMNPTPEWITLYQKDSGLVDAAMGNAVHIQLARKHGATILENAGVMNIVKQGNLTKVCTAKGDFLCRKVVITAGAWMNEVLSSVRVKIPLTVTQEQVTYYATPHMKEFTKDKCPVFILHTARAAEPYLLPIHGNTGFKIGLDVGGPVVTARTRDYTPDPKREKLASDYVKELCPRGLGPILFTKTCLYTLTPDRNFVIDNCRKTGYPDVIFCCGAGHAYKFAAVLGRILSQLAIDGRTAYDISMFNMDRPAIKDPNYVSHFQLGTEQATKATSKL
ncbi:monomeric sarcosine oxidase-like [Diadema antillarum]|uniref:monomeric sarcosine oxidase-like n=1 Tax=Diadema antillarum TaxID=105358 RepID=UPI003A882682